MKMPKPLATILFSILLVFFIFAPSLASAKLEIKANLSVENVEAVYAVATSEFKKTVNISMAYNSKTKLYEGSAPTEDAGEYVVTVFAVQNIGGKKYFANTTFPEKFFVIDCSRDENCAPIGSNFICNSKNQCELCSCGLDGACASCCEKIKMTDYDCQKKAAENKTDDIVFQIDATEKGFLKIRVFENVIQDLEVSATKQDAVSETKKVQGLKTSIAAVGAKITINLPSGKKIEIIADENGFAKVPIDKGELGQIIVTAQKGGKSGTNKVGTAIVEITGPAKILTQAKQAALVTAQVAAVPAAALGGWAIISFLSHLAIIFQSLLTAQISMSRAQLGKIKSAIQLIVLSFLLFSLRKLFAIFNATHFGGFNFDLTYAVSEILFFAVFLFGIMELNSSMKDISAQKPASVVSSGPR